MKEIRQGNRAKEPAFHKFHNNEPLRRDLFSRLQGVIRVRVQQSFSATVLMADYKRLNLEYEVKEVIGSPAAVATGVAIGKFLRWGQQKHPNEPFKIVCDQGMDEWGKLDDAVYTAWGFRLIPGVVRETPGLQASDFAAWELQRSTSDIIRGTLTDWSKVRPTLTRFLEQFTFRVDGEQRIPWYLVDGDQLRHLIETFSVPKRRSEASASPALGGGQP